MNFTGFEVNRHYAIIARSRIDGADSERYAPHMMRKMPKDKAAQRQLDIPDLDEWRYQPVGATKCLNEHFSAPLNVWKHSGCAKFKTGVGQLFVFTDPERAAEDRLIGQGNHRQQQLESEHE